MTVGSFVRRLLGERLFAAVSTVYRGFFINFDRVVSHFPEMGRGTTIVDVGGGDGAIHNTLLPEHPDARATIVDIAPSIGTFLEPDVRDRVTLVAGTTLDEYATQTVERPDWVLISDVIHHIPVDERTTFVRSVCSFIGDSDCTVIIKDVQPGGFRARLAWFADRYISGDRNVSFLTANDMETLVSAELPGFSSRHTGLLEDDGLNYCLIWQKG